MASAYGSNVDPTRFHRSQIKFYAVLLILAAFLVLPIIFMVSQAFKPLNELFLFPPRFFVQHPTWQNFRELFSQSTVTAVPITRYLFNSVVVAVATVLLTVVISSMAGYALSKLDFTLKKTIFEANVIALMFVPIAVTIPRYFIVVKLGLTNNMFGHIVPLLAVPVYVFLVKQFVDQVPDSLIEAAKIDGANTWYVFMKIVVPMIRPAIATIAILAFQTAWNNTETSNLYVNLEALKTFAFYINTLASNVGNQVAGQGIAAAAALLMFVPNLIIFIFLQGKVIATMAHSGLK